jgi:hypothetical protein
MRRNAGPRSARHETREGISNHKHHCAPSSSEVPFRPSPRGSLRPELSVTPKGVDGGLSSNTVRSTGSDVVSSQCLCRRAEGLKQSSCPHQRQAPKRGCAANNVIRYRADICAADPDSERFPAGFTLQVCGAIGNLGERTQRVVLRVDALPICERPGAVCGPAGLERSDTGD